MSEIEAVEKDPKEKRLTGVEGWLALFVVLDLFQAIYSLSQLNNPYVSYPASHLASAILQFVTVSLIVAKSRYALWLVGTQLAIGLIAGVWTVVVSVLQTKHVMPYTAIFVLGLSANIAWYLYFKTSRRVRYTLGSNLR